MVAQEIAADRPPANPPIIILSCAGSARAALEPGIESGQVLIHAEGDRDAGASLPPEAALDLAWRIAGCVTRLFRSQS